MGRKNSGEKPPIVVSRHGPYRFRRGLVTATFLQHGLSMDEALSLSADLRDLLLGREEITSDELESELDALLVAAGHEPLASQQPAPNVLMVQTEGRVFPFSRGVLVRRLVAVGLSVESSIALAQTVHASLDALGRPEVRGARVDAEVERLLGERHHRRYVRRYRVITFIRRSEWPVLVLVGGAAGTGKSTLSTELAYRLGISKVTSTDMIRETMRTVLSPAVVPGLHDHSFRGIVQGRQVLSDPQERVLAGFRQQALQVAVGVAGVVRRALRESTSMIIEGTHLVPPFTQLLAPGAETHFGGVVLAVPRRREHRRRFVRRAGAQPKRAAATYLDDFESVRWIHNDLVQLAEEHDSLVIDNDDAAATITGVVEYLSRLLPIDDKVASPTVDARSADEPTSPTLMLVLDGLSDEPHVDLAGQTPLAAAQMPFLRRLAGAGRLGLLHTAAEAGAVPDTAEGLKTLLTLGDWGRPLGRGLLEALGRGLTPHPSSVLLRGNLATVDAEGRLVDRRAGRIRDGADELLRELRDVVLPRGVTGQIHLGHEHRVVVSLQGPGLSPAVSDTDPGDPGLGAPSPPARPLDETPEAARTAEVLNHLLELVARHLAAHPVNEARVAAGEPAANRVITRGAAAASQVASIPQARRTSAIVSACPTVLGVGRLAGMSPATAVGMTGNLDTDLDLKFSTALDLLGTHEFVAVHFKGSDIAGHDRTPRKKRDFLAAIDVALGRFLAGVGPLAETLRIVVAGDHGTSSTTGRHMAEPVPLLVTRWDPEAEPAPFDEEAAATGSLGQVSSGAFASLLWPEPE